MSPEQQQLRNEVRRVQADQRATGGNVTGIHETERAIMEQRRVQEALEKAQPNFQRDGHGLRGPQQPVPLQIDGADGWGNSIQVKRKRGGEAEGAAAGGAANMPLLNKRSRFLAENAGVVSVETIDFTGVTV